MSKTCDKCGQTSCYSLHGKCLNCGNQQFPSKALTKKEKPTKVE
jgi:hypothetical protein